MKAEIVRQHIKTTDDWLGYTTSDIVLDQLSEIERLAEIGRATEKAFAGGYSLMKDDGDFEEDENNNDVVYVYDLKTIAKNTNQLVDWAKEGK